MDRIDLQPTDTCGQFKLRPGKPLPFGSTLVPGGVNFSVYSSFATSCDLVLFKMNAHEPYATIPFPDKYRIGHVFSMIIFDLNIEEIEYGFRVDGPFNPQEGHRFNKEKILMDPYAKSIGGRDVWGVDPDWNSQFQRRSRILLDDFDWEGDRPLELPIGDLVVYEMHVRGFTRHSSAKVEFGGTYAAIRAKIPYLKELGINCVELMPVHEFDEFENARTSPVDGRKLLNYWGYSNVGFFAPKAGLAASGQYGMQVDELKATIRELHRNGIEVMLDVVFNHTAEGNENGPYISYRGLDNRAYYILTPDGYYYNFSGCGNTLNCNNPIVRNMILDCLRYWASDYHIDGFRFDLASILGRDQNGAPMANPPLLEALAFDPILGKCKLVAEAWDAGGLYQVGSFPSWGRWAEWNGKYRDDVRKFLKGDMGFVEAISHRIAGSPDLYGSANRGARASVNFITCHDGFTMMDLVSYNGKHNEANGEENRDGGNDNHSWNCGCEGETDDPGILQLRRKQIKNAVSILLLSQGIPMILSGDEMGHTQGGNNNAYCQDNEISWVNWDLLKKNAEIFNFFKKIIAFRNAHVILRRSAHFEYRDVVGSGIPDISWHGTRAWQPDFSGMSRTFAFMLCGRHCQPEDNTLYTAFNMHYDALPFELPMIGSGKTWHVCANTDAPIGQDIWNVGMEVRLDNQSEILVGPRSVVILIAK